VDFISAGIMKPPLDSRLDPSGSGTDLPARVHPRYGVHWSLILIAATVMGVVSAILAWRVAISLGEDSASYWRWMVILNFAYWYILAALTPAIVWLSQHFRFERQGLARAMAVHLPSMIVFCLAHSMGVTAVSWRLAIAAGKPFEWWEQVQRSLVRNLDWEMVTYGAIVGVSHAVLYYRESRDRALAAASLETKLVAAQLKALQHQLHPHFLFNTLHAISTLMHRDVEAADRTLMQLSDLLRITLENTGQQEITLKVELEFLSKYLQIEQTRFADRLVARFDVQPETLDASVPNFILQPLVENAIKHGIAKKAGPGHIHISARRDGDKLLMEVRDDGVGLSEDALTALQKGIGVSTTRARLQHLFGADYRFEFHRQQAGLAVVIAIPWRTEAARAAVHGAESADTNITSRHGAVGSTRTRNGMAQRYPRPIA
jgi:two-component system LytT family sensor kinase